MVNKDLYISGISSSGILSSDVSYYDPALPRMQARSPTIVSYDPMADHNPMSSVA